MPPIVEQQNQIIACAGRKGSGKSTKAKELLQLCTRSFTYDTTGEHRWIPDRFTSLDDATIYLMETPTFPDFAGAYIPEDETDEKNTDFKNICSTVYEQGNMMFCIEEVVMLGVSPNYAPMKFRRVYQLGRHRALDLLYTTQRIGETPIGLRSQTDIFILFAQAEPADLDAIAKRCGVAIAKKVAGFEGHQFLIYDVNKRCEIDEIVLMSAAPAMIPRPV